jgi:hypothetical protein
MSGHELRRRVVAGVLAASVLLIGTAALAETRPPTAPSPKASKWEGPDLDATKNRAPAKGKSWYSLPEKEDEVLLRSKRKGGN